MKTSFLKNQFKYTGKELHSHFLYEMGVQGSGIISWIGPCEVKIDSMVDMEDRVNNDHIFSESMLHFMGEFFHKDIFYGIFVQRIIGEHVRSILKEMCGKEFIRNGDDLYLKEQGASDKKLNVSIATVSNLSSLVHFAVNISSNNTPVKTIGLKDLNIDPELFSTEVLDSIKQELVSIEKASVKVKSV